MRRSILIFVCIVDELYEGLLLFLSNPIDLNQATEQDLASLYILSNRQVQAFFDYKKRFGELVSVYELQAIPEFDL